MLQAVQNLRQHISPAVNSNTVKLLWDKPLNAVDVKVNGYRVMRSATAVYANAVPIANPTKTSFVDSSPLLGVNFYWVIAFNASGDSVLSDLVIASPILQP